MQLAGEAGSLLKIEEELQGAVRRGQEEWEEKQPLFRFTEFSLTENPRESYVRFVPGDGVTFWQRAEALVLEALRDYARHAGNGGRLQRQLFAEDAEQGFAFIDLCQKRFDVVLMNPPFGTPSLSSLALLEQEYTAVKHDLASAFLERALELCHHSGYVGSITTRTLFFLSYLSTWRENVIIQHSTLTCFADFGDGVLEATIETAAHILQRKLPMPSQSWFCRAIEDHTRQDNLISAIQRTQRGETCSWVFRCNVSTFASIDRSPFAYAVPDEVRLLFRRLPPFETDVRKAHIGALTQDDFRFVRTWWETDPRLAGRGWTSGSLRVWVPCVLGGTYSPYYADCPTVINWANDGETIKQFLSHYRQSKGFSDQWTSQLNAYEKYFLPGLTWSRRPNPQGSFWCLPEGCIFSSNSPAVLSSKDDILWLLGVVNSRMYRSLLDLLMPRGATSAQSLKYEVGYVRTVPIPEARPADKEAVRQDVIKCVQRLKRLDSTDETSHCFLTPFLVEVAPNRSLKDLWSIEALAQEKEVAGLGNLAHEIDMICDNSYGLSQDARQELFQNTSATAFSSNMIIHALCAPLQSASRTAQLLSWVIGVSFGRWDLRHLWSPRQSCMDNDPFAPLPICSPGVLHAENGLPATETPAEYPPCINWNGILVDDPDYSDDILRRVREVLELIWKARAEAIEKEACEILGVKELRDYLRKPGKGGFWDDHVSRYSKSRRKAPIYWLLQSSKRNYPLWVYYHRLDKDILFKALLNFVEPKIRLEQSRLDTLRAQKSALGDAAKGAKKIAKDTARQEALLGEVKDFEEKLRRAANLDFGKNLDSSVIYDPDLNDGVVLNIAPLWELVPWKEAKGYWDELLAGEYEWSSMGNLLRKKGLVQ
jgi:hypothetical protein